MKRAYSNCYYQTLMVPVSFQLFFFTFNDKYVLSNKYRIVDNTKNVDIKNIRIN